MSVVIRLENLGKRYRLGNINRRMLYEDMQRFWARLRGKADPLACVEEHRPVRPGDVADGLEARELWALKNVNLEIRDGEVVGIIGRNGSGKSTLLKILSKITAPTEGRALIKGRVASLLEVGTGFHAELTGRENVYMNASILGMTKEQIDRKFDEIVDFSGVEKFIDTPLKRYSSGMNVRLAFAVAAHLDPEIMIVDEVLAVGDSAFQQKCLARMKAVSQEGRTILFVSHSAAAVENLCTRGVVLDAGRARFDGTQMEAIAFYTNSFPHPVSGLRHRTDRKGRGDVKIVAIELRDAGGRVIRTAQAGADVMLYLYFETARAQFDSHDLVVHLFVKTLHDAPVFTHSNALSNQIFGNRLPEKGAFVCTLPRLPLPPSTYRLTYLLRASSAAGIMIDCLEFAFEFHVEGGDFFGSGRLPEIHDGTALVPGQWRLEPEAQLAGR